MPPVVRKQKLNWGDEEEDAAENETAADANGVKERVKISVNAKGQKVKTTTKLRVKEAKMKTPLRVFARRDLPRFGEAKEGEENVTLKSPDAVNIEHPDATLMEESEDNVAKTLANFITRQANRNLMRDQGIDGEFDPNEPASSSSTPAGQYVPPGQRAGALGGEGTYVPPQGGNGMSMYDKNDGTENTIRVSNLTKAVTEDDLRDLFDRFGRILRISLPKVERYDEQSKMNIKEPRGFAYIAFARHEDAEKALSLQGYGYDHLIIKLEWAKPTKTDPNAIPGNGMNANYMSGYGQKLAQDTTEKASYMSHGRQV